MLTPTTSLTTDHSSFDLQTIVQIMDQFLRSKKSSQTQRAYQQDIMSYFQQMQIVTVADLKRYTVYQLSDSILQYCDSFKKTDPYRTDRVLNPRTVNRKAYALSSFFEYLMAHFGYPRNPVKVFAPYTTPKTTSTDDLSQQEFDALRQYCQDLLIPIKPSEKKTDAKKTLHHYQQALIMTMLMMSLRRNEVANLRRDDRNQRNHVLTVYGKGQKEKYLPLPSLLIAQLATFSQFKTQYGIDSPYIFSALQNNSTHDTQKPISGSYIFQLVRKITHLLQIS
jgi:site-specific recombinase XerD